MRCVLCEEAIESYSEELHRFHVSDKRAVEICDACSRKFTTWQGDKLAKLFPAKAMKKLRHKSE